MGQEKYNEEKPIQIEKWQSKETNPSTYIKDEVMCSLGPLIRMRMRSPYKKMGDRSLIKAKVEADSGIIVRSCLQGHGEESPKEVVG